MFGSRCSSSGRTVSRGIIKYLLLFRGVVAQASLGLAFLGILEEGVPVLHRREAFWNDHSWGLWFYRVLRVL